MVSYWGFYRSAGSHALGFLKNMAVQAGTGGRYGYYQKPRFSLLEYVIIDKKSGKVLMHNTKGLESNPKKKYSLTTCLKTMIKDLKSTQMKGAKARSK